MSFLRSSAKTYFEESPFRSLRFDAVAGAGRSPAVLVRIKQAMGIAELRSAPAVRGNIPSRYIESYRG